MDNPQDIIKTSRRLFERVGIRSVTMDDISRELGISKKTLYVHFPQKDDLVKAVLFDISAEIEKNVTCFMSKDTSIWQVIEHFVESSNTLPDIRRIPPFFYDLNKYYPALAREHNEQVSLKNRATLSILLQRGINEGVFRENLDVELAACMFAQLHTSAIEESIKEDNPDIPAKRLTLFAFDVLVRGILTVEGLKRYETLKS